MLITPRAPVSSATTAVGNQELWKNDTLKSKSSINIGGSSSWCQGYNIHDFKKLKLAGHLLPYTPWKQGKVDWQGKPGLHMVTYSGTPTVSWWWKGHVHTYLLNSVNNLDEVVLENYLDKANLDARQYVSQSAAAIYGNGTDMLTFLLELKSTVRMIAGAFQSLLRLVSSSRSIADSWLEYRYGWRVLYYEIVGIAHSLASLEEKRTRYNQRSGGSVTNTYSDRIYYRSSNGYDFDHVTKTTVNVSARGSVVADIEPPAFRFDPIATAWELVKFSFVVDWFIDVGGWINTMRFLQNQTRHYASLGYKVTLTRNTHLEPISVWSPTIGNIMASTARANCVYSVRSPCTVPLTPAHGAGLDLLRYFDITAILMQALRRRS